MKIGIVGSDDRAVAIGRLFREGGHDVTFGDPKEKKDAEEAAAMVGARTQPPYNQAMCCDIVIFATQPQDVEAAVRAIGSGADAVVVDAIEPERGDGGLSGAEILSGKLGCHRLVRALINMPQSGASFPICGDDAHAKGLVDEALRACGCTTTDQGPLVNATELEAPPAAT